MAWQIDPFGHSSEVAAEFAEMGFDGLVLGRIDHEDIALRRSQKTMEMVWRPDVNMGKHLTVLKKKNFITNTYTCIKTYSKYFLNTSKYIFVKKTNNNCIDRYLKRI